MGAATDYARAVCEHPLVIEWSRLAEQEEESIDFIDALVPASDSPLTLG